MTLTAEQQERVKDSIVSLSQKDRKKLAEAKRLNDSPRLIARLFATFRNSGQQVEKDAILEYAKAASLESKSGESDEAQKYLLSILASVLGRKDNRKLDLEELMKRPDFTEYRLNDNAEKMWESLGSMIGMFEQSLNDIKDQRSKSRLEAIMQELEKVFERKQAVQRTPEELDILDLPDLDGLVKYIGTFNPRKSERREAIYTYWEDVGDKFAPLKSAYDDLMLMQSNIEGLELLFDKEGDKSINKLFENLSNNPPRQYVLKVKPLPLFTSKHKRFLDMMQTFAEALGYVAKTKKGKKRRKSSEPDVEENPVGGNMQRYTFRDKESGELTTQDSMSGATAKDPTIGMTQREADDYINQMSAEEFARYNGDVKEIQEDVIEIKKKAEIDPLLFIAYSQGKMKTSAFGYEEIYSISKKIETMKGFLITSEDGEDVAKLAKAIDKLEKDLQEEKSASRPRKHYSFPVTTYTTRELKLLDTKPDIKINEYVTLWGTNTKGLTEDKEEQNRAFLQALGELAFSVKETFGSDGRFTVGGDRTLGLARPNSSLDYAVSSLSNKFYPAQLKTPYLGNKGKERALQKNLKENVETLVAMMDGYFFEPSTKQFWPNGVKSKFTTAPEFKSLQRLDIKSPTTRFLDKMQDDTMGTIKHTQINHLAKFAQSMRNPRANKNPQDIEDQATSAYKTLNSMFGRADKKDNEVFLCSILYDIYTIFGMTDKEGNIKNKDFQQFPPTGGDIKKLNDKFKLDYVYPFQRLDFLTDGTAFAGAMTIGLSTSSAEKNMKNAISSLRTALTQKEASMVSINFTQLNTYDILKRAKGEEVSYGMLDHDNPDDVSYIQKQVVDIPAADLKIMFTLLRGCLDD